MSGWTYTRTTAPELAYPLDTLQSPRLRRPVASRALPHFDNFLSSHLYPLVSLSGRIYLVCQMAVARARTPVGCLIQSFYLPHIPLQLSLPQTQRPRARSHTQFARSLDTMPSNSLTRISLFGICISNIHPRHGRTHEQTYREERGCPNPRRTPSFHYPRLPAPGSCHAILGVLMSLLARLFAALFYLARSCWKG